MDITHQESTGKGHITCMSSTQGNMLCHGKNLTSSKFYTSRTHITCKSYTQGNMLCHFWKLQEIL